MLARRKGKGDGLATTVAVLARRKERERRRLSDYRCSVGATTGKERERRRLSDYRVAVLARQKGKRDDLATTVAVLARRRKGKETTTQLFRCWRERGRRLPLERWRKERRKVKVR